MLSDSTASNKIRDPCASVEISRDPTGCDLDHQRKLQPPGG